MIYNLITSLCWGGELTWVKFNLESFFMWHQILGTCHDQKGRKILLKKNIKKEKKKSHSLLRIFKDVNVLPISMVQKHFFFEKKENPILCSEYFINILEWRWIFCWRYSLELLSPLLSFTSPWVKDLISFDSDKVWLIWML